MAPVITSPNKPNATLVEIWLRSDNAAFSLDPVFVAAEEVEDPVVFLSSFEDDAPVAVAVGYDCAVAVALVAPDHHTSSQATPAL